MTMKERIEEKMDEYVEKILDKEEIDEKDFATLQICYTFYAMRELRAFPQGVAIC